MEVVYLEGRQEVLSGRDCTVLKSYEFGEDTVCIICDRCEDFDDISEVKHVEPEFEAGLRWSLDGVDVGLHNVATMEDARQLHNLPQSGGTGEGMTVVAMDSGVDKTHPVFSDTNLRHYDVTGMGTGDDVGHGTAVMGQIHQIAPDADLFSLRIFGQEGRTSMEKILEAYEWLHENADSYDIVNMSWGATANVETVNQVHKKLLDKGVHAVVAAGNSGGRGGSPATEKTAFSVGACTSNGRMTAFSSYNPHLDNPDVTAVGRNNRLAQASGTTMGEQLSGRWVKASGTSFAAPLVAGMMAKVGNPDDVEEILEETARDIPEMLKDGAGIADYQEMSENYDQEDTTYAKVWAWAGRDIAYINKDWLKKGKHTARRREDGAVVILPKD